ncbi:MAG: hypothetical protein ACE15B_04205 [Bryobacteraceae bacterium]
MKTAIAALLVFSAAAFAAGEVLVPEIDGPWWQVAGDPDLGRYTTPKQQPVDFAIWQAADGTWQIWSCVRGTACGGKTRLFHRWQGAKITDSNWQPMGIAMEADAGFGETPGGLQAPYVMKLGREYVMFYGDWENICKARSVDGKTFARQLQPNGKAGMFTEGPGNNTRDVMVIRVGKLFHAYYTAYPNRLGADYVRTSKDLNAWSASKKVAFGGDAGTGPYSAECPFVYYHKASGYYYLFRTQRYGQNALNHIYRSKDPTNFGINDDRFLVRTLPVAAPEIVEHEGQLYIAALLPSLKGIQIAKLKFVPKK